MEEETVDGVKISEFPTAQSVTGNDLVTGLKVESEVKTNANFTVSSLLSAIIGAVRSAFVPANRKVNGKTLDSDISLTASDVGLGNVANERQYSAQNPPPLPAPSDIGAQDTITASGILKGDGQGGVSAATPGTDYGTYSKPSGGIPASDLANGVIPTVPSAYTSNPAMDGTASPGTSNDYARGDHVHPTDSTKTAKSDLTSIQATGTTNTTGATIPAGACFYLNGVLHKAKIQIDVNAPFTPGTNCEPTTVGNQLSNVVFDTVSTSGTYASIVTGYAGAALDSVAANIANYSSGVYQVTTPGPSFTVVLGKWNNNYYSGLIFGYSSSVLGLFRNFNGQKSFKQIATI